MSVLEYGMHVIDAEHVAEEAPAPVEFCEQCAHPLPPDAIGWCTDCGSPEQQRVYDMEDFYAWGGWRRAFGEYTDEEWAARTPCRYEVRR